MWNIYLLMVWERNILEHVPGEEQQYSFVSSTAHRALHRSCWVDSTLISERKNDIYGGLTRGCLVSILLYQKGYYRAEESESWDLNLICSVLILPKPPSQAESTLKSTEHSFSGYFSFFLSAVTTVCELSEVPAQWSWSWVVGPQLSMQWRHETFPLPLPGHVAFSGLRWMPLEIWNDKTVALPHKCDENIKGKRREGKLVLSTGKCFVHG